MIREIVSPVHIARIGNGMAPFFKGSSPNPEVPKHDHDRLVACLGVSDTIREKFRHALANGPFKNAIEAEGGL